MLTTANIVIIRDRGLAYSGCFMAVRFNGVLAARLDTGEVSSFFFKPGEVVINVGRDPMGRGLCFSFCDNRASPFSSETIIKAGEKKVFRIGSGEGFDWVVIRVFDF